MLPHVIFEALHVEDGYTQQLGRIARPGDLLEFDKGHDIAAVRAACGAICGD